MSGRWTDRAPFTALGLVWPGPVPVQAPGPTAPDGAPAFRLVVGNALKSNRQAAAWAREALALSPDVLGVVELAPRIAGVLEGCLEHSCLAVRPRSEGTGVWSRLPIDTCEVRSAGNAMVVVRLALGVTVAVVHTVAPARHAKVRRWHESFDAVQQLLDETAGPLVVAGDWNATFAHGPMQDLLARGRVRDAHVDAGRPRARTWNARFPTALLDHVLVSEEIAVSGIAEHRLPGSDHLALCADLALAAPDG